MSSQQQQIPLRILIDKPNNKVVAVESTKDFVDTLFSFLCLPLATIIRLLTKRHEQQQQPPPSILGSITNLYHSVENLTPNDVWNTVCKDMLLCPRNPCESLCSKLLFNVDDTKPTPKVLVCNSCNKFTTFPTLDCVCGKRMEHVPGDLDLERKGKNGNNNNTNVNVDAAKTGVFVKENGSLFLVFDDLTVVPSSLVTSMDMMLQLGYSDLTHLAEYTCDIGKDEILNLLKYTISSHEPLTNLILASNSKKKDNPPNPFASAIKVKVANTDTKMEVKIVQSKSQNKVLFAESTEDFVDFMFSLLAIPLGSVIKLLNGNSLIGCVDNLYKSVETLHSSWCTESRFVLLNPGIVPQFGCLNQPLNIPDVEPTYYYGKGVYEKDNHYGRIEVPRSGGVISKSDHDIVSAKRLTALDPRSPNRSKEDATGFVKRPALYAVGDDLRVRPLSADSCLYYLKDLNLPLDDLEVKVISISEAAALSLLGASLTSKQTLTTGLKDFLDVPRQELDLASKYTQTSQLDLLKHEPNPEP
ncbi:uncharacterized protein LOC130963248 [Arachis stenosperma]|uniref:uncharacterized protein LOC130963248 n=1 Tax=Arachis stenosperma TaxID=217475 RepID=UPI0025ACE491|nr:uncharacterized protein LOC130963248 [Arachis stenosperma]